VQELTTVDGLNAADELREEITPMIASRYFVRKKDKILARLEARIETLSSIERSEMP